MNYINEIWYEKDILNVSVKHHIWKRIYYNGRLRNEIRNGLENTKENLEIIFEGE